MKSQFFIAVSVLFAAFASSMATASQPTPAVNSSVTSSTQRPLFLQVHTTMKQQLQKIAIDQKNGKLTTEQAITLRKNLKTIRKQVGSYSKSNPNHELTTDQASQTNQQLQTNAQSIP